VNPGAAAALKTPVRNGHTAQGVNLNVSSLQARPLDAATAYPALMLFNIINGLLILLRLVIAPRVDRRVGV